ncbi:MAG TPA: hypothetical protein VFW00_01745, partial [Rhodocyclaceae bacterium]|nr:hypothetical protein [Rhodocyclaceae bacterium]
NALLRAEMKDAAQKTTTPVILMDAQNDRTTDSITTLADVVKGRNVPYRMVIYPPFTPQKADPKIAPGHLVFSAQGVDVWKDDVLEFLGRYLGTSS